LGHQVQVVTHLQPPHGRRLRRGNLCRTRGARRFNAVADRRRSPSASTAYGSGSCAEFYSATIGADARVAVAEARIDQQLSNRRGLTVKEYEACERAVFAATCARDYTPPVDLIPSLYTSHYAGQSKLVFQWHARSLPRVRVELTQGAVRLPIDLDAGSIATLTRDLHDAARLSGAGRGPCRGHRRHLLPRPRRGIQPAGALRRPAHSRTC